MWNVPAIMKEDKPAFINTKNKNGGYYGTNSCGFF
jgi:hypothetical protein